MNTFRVTGGARIAQRAYSGRSSGAPRAGAAACRDGRHHPERNRIEVLIRPEKPRGRCGAKASHRRKRRPNRRCGGANPPLRAAITANTAVMRRYRPDLPIVLAVVGRIAARIARTGKGAVQDGREAAQAGRCAPLYRHGHVVCDTTATPGGIGGYPVARRRNPAATWRRAVIPFVPLAAKMHYAAESPPKVPNLSRGLRGSSRTAVRAWAISCLWCVSWLKTVWFRREPIRVIRVIRVPMAWGLSCVSWLARRGFGFGLAALWFLAANPAWGRAGSMP